MSGHIGYLEMDSQGGNQLMQVDLEMAVKIVSVCRIIKKVKVR